ncbi:MAG TPA: hypothetical protein VGP01_07220 [Rhizomicrobium sp.]|jgi:hypothetical protein|nr:hypothetical protein [Rhizomicrobium sp.]
MTELKTIWQNQPMEDNEMITLADIRARADSVQARVRWRNLALYAYSIANIAITVWLLSTGKHNFYAAPGLLLLAAHLFVIWQLWWRTSVRAMPADLSGRAALDYLRHQLERQRDAFSSAWLWYIAPFMPGLIWELWLRANLHPADIRPGYDHALVLYLVLAALFFWTSVGLAFSWAASRLDVRLERLNTLKAE